MDKKKLEKERNELFDANFKYKSTDIKRIIKFCKTLREITGVQVCNAQGSMYEYLPQIYRSALNKLN